MNPLNPKKLLLTKWTAVKPLAKQKHFLVSRVIQPELPTDPVESVEIEAVFSKATQIMAWRGYFLNSFKKLPTASLAIASKAVA
jgi:hypothetical protein